MQVSATDSSTTATTAATDVLSRIPAKTLSQDDFLKLVVAQLTTQDPLNPQTDTQFIAQMTQFTALQQTQAMKDDIEKLRAAGEISQSSGLLGRSVQLQDANGALSQGTVTAVQVEAGTPQLIVNGQPHDLAEVVMIESAAPNP